MRPHLRRTRRTAPERGRRRTWPVLLLVAVLAVATAGALARWATDAGPATRAGGSDGDRPAPTGSSSATGTGGAVTGSGDAGAAPEVSDRELAERFLSRYVDGDGRVVRHDQGGDTVSEGQAYALLLAAATGDEPTFDRVWSWTSSNLQRPDGLLSWTWRDGEVVDANSASDADVDAAHALVLGATVFDRPDLRSAGEALGEAILDNETQQTPVGRVLLAGQWAKTAPYQVNPSYGSPAAYAVMGSATGDRRWDELARGDRAVVRELLAKSPLPPDWAQVAADGSVAAMPPPGGGDVSFGLDAQRIAIRYAASCAGADRDLSAKVGASLPTVPAQVRGIYDLGGSARVPWQHPVALVAAAAATSVSGSAPATDQLLRAASALDARSSTYYGAAWAALGSRLLDDPASLGISCTKENS